MVGHASNQDKSLKGEIVIAVVGKDSIHRYLLVSVSTILADIILFNKATINLEHMSLTIWLICCIIYYPLHIYNV